MVARSVESRAGQPSPASLETRVRRVMELSLEYIPNPEFEEAGPGSEGEERAPIAPDPGLVRRPRLPPDTPAYLASLYDVPLLSREQERGLFRHMNFLKFKAASLRQRLNPQRPRIELLEQVERLYEQAIDVKNRIIQANLRLVVSIAKRFASRENPLFELVSDGNVTLMRAVEKFDFARGFRFSTYATWSLNRAFARGVPQQRRQRQRFGSLDRRPLDLAADDRADVLVTQAEQVSRHTRVRQMLDVLNDRERHIIISRYGLDERGAPVTCRQLGDELGVSKERIRQIELRALEKLRNAASDEDFEIPALAG